MSIILSIQNSNKNYYNKIWKNSHIFDPTTWPHWKIIQQYTNCTCLEIGPGTKPKIPIKGNYFIDISKEVVMKLNSLGGKALQADLLQQFQYKSSTFDLICAFEVLEHIPNDHFVLKEFARLLKKDGTCLLSFPINMKYWNTYDRTVGHIRRYDPQKVEQLFNKNQLTIVKYSALSIPWPNQYTAVIFSYFAKKAPGLVSKFTDFIDSLPWAPIHKPIHLETWSKDSPKYLTSFTTVLLQLKKQ